MRVVKIGGNKLDQPGFILKMARTVAALPDPIVLIHGGGKAVDELQVLMGSEPVKVKGMRRTDPEALRAVLMILCGLVSKQIVAALVNSGMEALGLCGVDAGLIRVRRLHGPEVDLGLVGEIVSVRDDFLRALLDRGVTPVISPVSLGLDGRIYNVNADHVASVVASALGAGDLDFVSDVSGILQAGQVLPRLTVREAERLITTEEIEGGMIPKVRAGGEALRRGVPNVRYIDLAGLARGGGTTLTPEG